MKLINASRYFDKIEIADAYDPTVTIFKAQLDVYSDAMRDGLTVQRRILECAPEHERPERSTIRLGPQVFLMGEETYDYFKGKPIRKKFVLHEADTLGEIYTLAQALEGVPGHTAWTAKSWVKSTAETEESSKKYNQIEFFFAPSETAEIPSLILFKDTWHIARERFVTEAGFLAVMAEELLEPVIETIELTRSEYDRITETYTQTNTPVRVLRLRWQTYFEYESEASTTFRRGDMRVIAPVDSGIEPGATITMSDGEWNVLTQEESDGVLVIHARKV